MTDEWVREANEGYTSPENCDKEESSLECSVANPYLSCSQYLS